MGWAGPGRWIRVLPKPGEFSPLYYGARCDGSADDAPAINAAITEVRQQTGPGDMSALTGIVRLPAKRCMLSQTINATRLRSASVTIEGTGGALICGVPNKPCIDAFDSARLSLRDITLYGEKQAMPSIGLELGRPTHTGSAAGMYLDHVSISGFFSFTAFYNLSAETQLAVKLNASNNASSGFGAVYDGLNHWKAHSDFVQISMPIDHPDSFNDNTCLNCRITSSGDQGVPVWIGGTSALTFENSYISNFRPGVGAVLFGSNTNLNFDAHFEAGSLTDVFRLAGQRHMVIYGFAYHEHDFFGQHAMFSLDQNTETATLENVNVDIGRIHGKGTWFDNPANYTMSGRVTGIASTGWTDPTGGFSGTSCFANTCVTR
jgi:hypothetical protein